MKKTICSAALLFTAALAPPSAAGAVFDLSDVEVKASASVSTQLKPQKADSAVASGPLGSVDPAKAEVLVIAETNTRPFPNRPTSQTRAYASSASDSSGAFGVGVSGFFFGNSLPPNSLVARGSSTRSITNHSTTTLSVVADFHFPGPVVQFFGVGNSFPVGADPARDARAFVEATMSTRVTHADGSVIENVALAYGINVLREPVSGVLVAFPSGEAGLLRRFEEPDGSFGFELPDRQETDFPVGKIGPGDVFEFIYEYAAEASTGFGETGIFAAIGDPFDLRVTGGSFDLRVDVPDTIGGTGGAGGLPGSGGAPGAGGASAGTGGMMGGGGSADGGGPASGGTSGGGGSSGGDAAAGAAGATDAGDQTGSDAVGGHTGLPGSNAETHPIATKSGGCDCRLSPSGGLDPGLAGALVAALVTLCRRRDRSGLAKNTKPAQ